MLIKHFNKEWDDLLPSEQNALVEYSGTQYGITNRYLRNALYSDDDIEWDKTAQRVKEIDRALDKNTLGDDLVLYRYVEFDEFEWWTKNDVLNTYKSSAIDEKATSFLEIIKLLLRPQKHKRFLSWRSFTTF